MAFQITRVEPSRLAPGVDVVIEGSGFGHNAGSVVVLNQGRTFAVEIGQWEDGLITGRLDEGISGVTKGQGVLRVQRAHGGHRDVNMTFVVPYDLLLLTEWGHSVIWERPKTVTFFDGMTLGAHWHASSESVVFLPLNPAAPACPVTLGSPVATAGNPTLATVAVLSDAPDQGLKNACWAHAALIVWGPRGVDPGVEGGVPLD